MKSTTFLRLASAFTLAPSCAFAQTAPAPVRVTPAASAQTVTVKVQKTKPDYSGEPSLFERLDRVYTYNADGTGTRSIAGVVRVQTQAAVKDLSVIDFPFASSSEHIVLDYVRVIHPDGSIVATPATDAQEQPAPVTREAPFYSDLKDEQVPVRSLAVGDRLEYQVHFVRTKAEAPNHFWGKEDLVTPLSGLVALEESLIINVPSTSYIQVWSPNFTPTVTDANGQRTYRFNNSQLIPVAGKDRKALLQLEKHPDLSGGESMLPDVQWTNYHSWQEVGEWYRSLEGSRTEPNDDVKAKVAQLIEGKSTPEEKARAIYGFVGPQIRYIGVAFGIGRYQPHEAGDILANQYGDCKDKTTLLTSMLAAAGITADAALIGAGATFNPAVPSPGAFNHVITLAHVDNQPVWLDSTAEIAPYRLLVKTLRGKQALVIPLVGDPHLETTPKDLPFPFEESFQAIGSIDDQGTSHSKITLELRGDEELPFRQSVRSVSPAQWDDLMQRISYNLGYAGKVTNAEFARPDQTAAPYRVTYDYERDKSGDWDNLRILPQLPPFGLGDVDEKDPPITPIDLSAPGVWVAHSVMKLPAGWSAELPTNIHAKSSFATLDKTYKLEDGAVVTDRRIVVTQEKIPASQWREFHQWYKDASLDSEPYIQLTRAGVAADTTPSNDQAEQLITEANGLEQKKDFDLATQKLDQAKALNNRQAFLWSNYGFIALQHNKTRDAIEDLRREVSNHPQEWYPYRLLAYALGLKKDTKGAIDALEQYLATNPGQEEATTLAATMLEFNKDYPGAEVLLRKQVAANTSSLPLKNLFADALLHNHKPDEARPLLIAVATTSTDPIQLNNAAYFLADSSLDLPTAEAATRKALAILTEASNNGETGKPALTRSELLINTWDTFGWILYREKKVAEATPWLRAGWLNGLSADEGLHLGTIQMETNQGPEALSTLQLALNGQKGTDTDATLASIHKSIDALDGKGIAPADGPKTLQEARTYKVPRPDKLPQFWATVNLEITSAGTQSVSYDNDPDAPTSMLPAVKALDLHLAVPSEGKPHLFRRGILSCHNGPTCDFILEFPSDAIRE